MKPVTKPTETGVTVAPKKNVTIQEHLTGDQFKQQIAMILPKHLTPERFCRVALTALTRVPKLAQCDQHSFFKCLLDLSALGLEPDGRRAHLIPFENKKRGCVECQLIVDYKGLVELALRSGQVSNLHADVVCENDGFEYDLGEIKRHAINFKEDRGRPYAAYAICTFKDGTRKSEVMSREEIEAIRARSRAAQNGPWVSDWNEMAKKTVFRRLSKWVTLSPELRDAVELDDEPIEQKRFEVAKPIFQTTAPIALPDPELDLREQLDQKLAERIVIESELLDFMASSGYTDGSFASIDDLPDAIIESLLKDLDTILTKMKAATAAPASTKEETK